MKTLGLKDVQYVYTTNCKLGKESNYCNMPLSNIQKTGINRIKDACDIFKRHDLQVKVLGGNPSDEPDFEEFISYMNKQGINYVVTDNAMNFQKLLDCNVSGVMFSMDTLGKSDIGGCSFVKSIKAKEAIPIMKNSTNYIGANVVINSANISEIPDIVAFLSHHGAVANLCPLIVGSNKDFIYRVTDSEYSLLNVPYSALINLRDTLLRMKKDGYLIGCPSEYINMMPYLISKRGQDKYNWNCSSFLSMPLLRVNADLSIMVCSDIVGAGVSNHTVFDLDDNMDEINNAWVQDMDRINCCDKNGCYWSNIVIASIYKESGTLESTRRNL